MTRDQGGVEQQETAHVEFSGGIRRTLGRKCRLDMDMESYCLKAASLVNSLISNNSIFAFLLEEIKVKMKEHSSSITHIRRTTNIASDYMANLVEPNVELLYGWALDQKASLTLSGEIVIPKL